MTGACRERYRVIFLQKKIKTNLMAWFDYNVFIFSSFFKYRIWIFFFWDTRLKSQIDPQGK